MSTQPSVLAATSGSGRKVYKILAGVPGLTGPRGPQGPQGDVGPQGPSGAATIGSAVSGGTPSTRLYVDSGGLFAGVVYSDRTTLPAETIYSDGTTAFSTLQTFNAGLAAAFGRWTEIDLTASPISGTVGNYTLGGQVGTLYRIAGTGGSAQITGLSISQVAGRVVTLFNAGTETILLGGTTGSNTQNKFAFATPNGLYALIPGASVSLIYDGSPTLLSRRWRPNHSAGALGGLYLQKPTSGWTDYALDVKDETGTTTQLAMTFDGDLIDANGRSRILPAYTAADIGKVFTLQDDGSGGAEPAWADSYIPPDYI